MKILFCVVLSVLMATEASAAPMTSKELGAVKQAVANELKDPLSATFSGVERVPRADGVAVACGWVNAKNSYGGYVGKQRFAVLGYLEPMPTVTLATANEVSVAHLCTPQSPAQHEAEKQSDIGAVCARSEFNLAASGKCGQLHAQCWLEAAKMASSDKENFMLVCRRKGFDAAKEALAESDREATKAALSKWPNPAVQSRD